MKKDILIILTILVSFSFLSQEKKKDRYKFMSGFDMRNSVVIGHSVKFNGGKLGLGNSKYRFGIGLYKLRRPVRTNNYKLGFLDATDVNRYNFGVFSLFYERIIHQSKRWELTAPIHLNFGALKGEYLSQNGRYEKFLEKNVTSLTLSVKGHFKVFRWIGVSTGVGYNALINEDRRTRKALNAPFYSFGAKFFLVESWRLVTNKEYRKSDWTE